MLRPLNVAQNEAITCFRSKIREIASVWTSWEHLGLNLRFELGQRPRVVEKSRLEAHAALIGEFLSDTNASTEHISELALATAHSPYLTSLVRRYPAIAQQFLEGQLEAEMAKILQVLEEPRPATETIDEFISYLRVQKIVPRF